jgi:hypothetical protein
MNDSQLVSTKENKGLSWTIAICFLLLLCFGVAACVQQETASQKNKISIKSIPLEELKERPAGQPPIRTAQEAVNYALTIHSFINSLQDAETTGGSAIRWNVTAQRLTHDSPVRWEVKAQSTNTVASCEASISFTAEGELLPQLADNYDCVFRK